MPFLSRVPFIGPLFGARSKASFRSETLVMITPTVVESAVDLKEVSKQMEKEFSKVPPLKISRLNKVDRKREDSEQVDTAAETDSQE